MLRALASLLGLTIAFAAAIAAGIWAGRMMTATDGGAAPAIHLTHSLVPTVASLLAAAGLALLIGAAVARWWGNRSGMFFSGVTLAALSLQSGTIADFLRLNGQMWLLAAECLMWACLIAIIWIPVAMAGGGASRSRSGNIPLQPPPVPSVGRRLLALLAGLLVLPVVWLMARSEMKGQVLAATAIGSLVGAFVGYLVAPTEQRGALYLVPMVAGAMGYMIVQSFVPDIEITRLTEGVTPLALPMPQDYAAGSLLGISLGISWARSFLIVEGSPSAPTTRPDQPLPPR